MSKESRLLLEDMLEAAQRIAAAAGGVSADALADDRLLVDAVLYNFIVLGEAARRLPDELTSKAQEVPWRAIVAMRNVIAHAYDSVSLETVADTINVKVPALIRELERLLQELE
ncbi:MAG TPA: DUF86 domain-containing protein [Firmicutes bacterium]|nr:DUF86 domain-containing protein [Bacillota bacterium]